MLEVYYYDIDVIIALVFAWNIQCNVFANLMISPNFSTPFWKMMYMYFCFFWKQLQLLYWSLFIFSHVILLLICKVLSIFSSLKMISARSKRRRIFSLIFILKCVSKKLRIRTEHCRRLLRYIRTLRQQVWIQVKGQTWYQVIHIITVKLS